MTAITLASLQQAVMESIDGQAEQVAAWHQGDPGDLPEPVPASDLAVLVALVARENQTNYRLWHVEDEARRTDVDDADIADCKRRIDGLNQHRNDLIEKVDVFDIYADEASLGPGKCSLAYTVVYRDRAKTMTDEEVNAVHDRVRHHLSTKLGVELR